MGKKLENKDKRFIEVKYYACYKKRHYTTKYLEKE